MKALKAGYLAVKKKEHSLQKHSEYEQWMIRTLYSNTTTVWASNTFITEQFPKHRLKKCSDHLVTTIKTTIPVVNFLLFSNVIIVKYGIIWPLWASSDYFNKATWEDYNGKCLIAVGLSSPNFPQRRYKLLHMHQRSPSSKCTILKWRWWLTTNREMTAPVCALQATVFSFQVKTQHLTTTPSLSLPLYRPLFIQILQMGYFFQFSTFTSFVRERHYACVIMQFITNNRFVYGGPRLSPALSAAFSK